MRMGRLLAVLACAAPLAGCLQSSTVVTVNADGSGTVAQTTLLGAAALQQLRQLAGSFGGGKPVDPFSEEQARAAVRSMGEGVTLVSSTPVSAAEGEGRTNVYAFTDINRLRVNQRPATPGGISIRTQGIATGAPEDITFSQVKQPDGNLLLRILFPDPKLGPHGELPPQVRTPPPPDQVASLKQMLAGMRIDVAVEPAGRVVRTNSAYVTGQRVTLLELDFDRMLGDETVLGRLQGLQSLEDAKAAVRGVPGLKVNLEREITVEFTPAR